MSNGRIDDMIAAARATEWFTHYHITYKSLEVLLLKFIYLEKSVIVSGFPLDDVVLYSGNCSDFQISLQTDYFVDRTFRGSN